MISDLRLSVLVENYAASPSLRSEHGFALMIEADNWRILLDTGDGTALVPNAVQLGVDLARIHAVVLSHGHRDHSGALDQVLRIAPTVPVFMHPAALRERYSLRHGSARSIGLPTAGRLAVEGADVRFTSRRTALTPDIWCSGEIPAAADERPQDPWLSLDSLVVCPDPLTDDQALVIMTTAGAVVCCGCCHAGIAATLRHVRSQAPNTPILAVIGGLHLHACDSSVVEQQHLAAITKHHVHQVLAGHCTGAHAEAALATALGQRFAPLRCGTRWQLHNGQLIQITEP